MTVSDIIACVIVGTLIGTWLIYDLIRSIKRKREKQNGNK